MKKYFLLLFILAITGAGCRSMRAEPRAATSSVVEKQRSNPVEAPAEEDRFAEIVTEGAPAGFGIYRSKDIGIELQFPLTLGRPWENWYKGRGLLFVKFLDEQGEPASIDIGAVTNDTSAEDKNPTFRSCEDFMENGRMGDDFPLSCESKFVDGNAVRVMTLPRGRIEAQFVTKLGVWSLLSEDAKLVNVFNDMLESLKFIE